MSKKISIFVYNASLFSYITLFFACYLSFLNLILQINFRRNVFHISSDKRWFKVSSDSDFTSTVRELREAGIYTIGVGERKTPRALQNAYNEFWFLDEFAANKEDTRIKSNKIITSRANKNNNKKSAIKVSKKVTLEDIVAREINRLQKSLRRNWILVASLGGELKKRGIEFNTGLNDFVRHHERFILTKDKDTDAWLVTVNRDYQE